MTEPNAAFLDGKTPTIKLAGKEWPVPLLAPRQNRYVVPAILSVAPKIMYAVAPQEGVSPARLAATLDPAAMDQLGDICFWALKRAHKDMTRDEFDDMPINVMEMAIAMKVISEQTGLVSEKAPAPGEAEAAAPSPTGTE